MKKNGKIIKCKVCGDKIYVSQSRWGTKKYCSWECGNYDNWGFKPRKKKCVICGEEFEIISQLQIQNKTCSKYCHNELAKKISQERKKRTIYKYGFTMNRKDSGEHLRACSKYKKEFIKKHGKVYCESCKTKNSLKFETHHILSAGRHPKHPELHNPRNLILLCIQCHNDFHSSKRKQEYNKLLINRGLDKLFRININHLMR